jgi:hypothetical protein
MASYRQNFDIEKVKGGAFKLTHVPSQTEIKRGSDHFASEDLARAAVDRIAAMPLDWTRPYVMSSMSAPTFKQYWALVYA